MAQQQGSTSLRRARLNRVEAELDKADGAKEARLLLEFHSLKEGLDMEISELAKIGRTVGEEDDLSKLTDAQLIAEAQELGEAADGFVHVVGQAGGLTRAEKDEQTDTHATIIKRADALRAEGQRRTPAALSQEELTEKLDIASRSGDYDAVKKYQAALQGIVDGLTRKAK